MNQLPKVVSYDLTTTEGMKKAIADSSILAVLAMSNPLTAFSYGAYKFGSVLFDKAGNAVAERKKVIDEQRKVAVDIIKAGKNNGASKIRVTLNQKAGIDIGGALEGYSMKFSIGTDDQMTIEAEYK